MATGRIGVTPTLRTRWSKAPAGGTTSLSGLDDNSVSLVYDVGYEAVYRNGVLLSRTNDYTATTGNSITLIDATIAGDIIEVFANQLLPLTNAIGNGQYTAKGALLSATAASTPAVLTVGSNNQVLTADSTTSTGLKWATPSSGGMTLISSTSITAVTKISLTSIPSTYKDLRVVIRNFQPGTDDDAMTMIFNDDSNARYRAVANTNTSNSTFASNNLQITGSGDNGTSQSLTVVDIFDYTNTSTWKLCTSDSLVNNATTTSNLNYIRLIGAYNQTGAINELNFGTGAGTAFSATGTILLYGVS